MAIQKQTASEIAESGRSDALENLYSVASFWVFVWGLGMIIGTLVESALSEFSRGWRLSLSAIALFATVAVTLATLHRSRKAQATIRTYRHLYMLLAAAALGYAWHGYTNAQSDAAWTGKAAVWACSQLSECRQSAEGYGERIGKTVFFPAEDRAGRRP